MTRGSFYLFMPNIVLESIEFNGGMYPDGHGDDALTLLRTVKTEKDFRNIIADFNTQNHQYEHKLVFINKRKSTNFAHGYFDLQNSFTCYFSDWIFIKNLSGKTIAFDQKDSSKSPVMVKHGQTVRFNYGNVPDNKKLFTKTLEESNVTE